MAEPKINTKDLIKVIAKKTGVKPREVAKVLDGLTSIVSLSIKLGQPVTITGFGRFSPRRYRPSVRRNPRTQEEIKVSERLSISFAPGSLLKRSLNGNHSEPVSAEPEAQLAREEVSSE